VGRVTTAAWRTPSGSGAAQRLDDDSARASGTPRRQGRRDRRPVRADDRRRRLSISLTRRDKIVVRDLDSLRAELARIPGGLRHPRRGARTRGRRRIGTGARLRRRVVAALNVSAPKSRISDRLESLGGYVARAAERLSGHIGGHIGAHISGAAFRA